jgi:hypothetical protein
MGQETDAEIEELISWLSARGFTVSREQYPKSNFGNWFRELHGPGIWLVLTRERGEWLIAATPAGSRSWYSLAAWEHCLGRAATTQLADDPSARGVAHLQRALEAMQTAAAADDSSLKERLEAAQEALHARAIPRLPPEAFSGGAMLTATDVSDEMRRDASARLARRKRERRSN